MSKWRVTMKNMRYTKLLPRKRRMKENKYTTKPSVEFVDYMMNNMIDWAKLDIYPKYDLQKKTIKNPRKRRMKENKVKEAKGIAMFKSRIVIFLPYSIIQVNKKMTKEFLKTLK